MTLVARLGAMHVGAEPLLPVKVEKLKPEDIRSALTANLEAHNLKKESEELDGVTQVVCRSRTRSLSLGRGRTKHSMRMMRTTAATLVGKRKQGSSGDRAQL